MPARAYVELHAKSAFSFLEGASTPEQLAAECARYGQHAVALTDSNGLYGSPRLHYTAKKIGIKPLIALGSTRFSREHSEFRCSKSSCHECHDRPKLHGR